MTFDYIWFQRHQRALLILLNLPIIGQVLRRAMWVPELWMPVTHITPDTVHVALGLSRRRSTHYTNPQYAEGLHRSFGWLWALVHAWDMRVANRWLPALNMGLDTYTSQPSDTAGVDVFVQSNVPTSNNSSANQLVVGNTGGATYRSLVKFDLSTILSGSTVNSAVFSLWQSVDNSTNARTFRLFRLLVPYVFAQVTWNVRATGTNWGAAGAFGVADAEQTDIARRSMTASEANGEKQWTDWDLDELAEMCGISPSVSNNGWLIKADTESSDAYNYRSARYTTAGERPKLVIDYVPSSGWWYFF